MCPNQLTRQISLVADRSSHPFSQSFKFFSCSISKTKNNYYISFSSNDGSFMAMPYMSNGKIWESMPMSMFLEVPLSMPMSMPMFLLEGFSMAMPMSILFQVLYQCQCQWQCLMLCLNVNSNANVLPCLEKATITIRWDICFKKPIYRVLLAFFFVF